MIGFTKTLSFFQADMMIDRINARRFAMLKHVSLDEPEENEAYLTIGKGAAVLALKSTDPVSTELSVE